MKGRLEMKSVKQIKWLVLAVCMMLAVACSGIGNQSSQGTPTKADDSSATKADKSVENVVKPVTLTVYINTNVVDDKSFKEQFIDPLQKIHPNISLKQVVRGDMQPDKIVTTGTDVDIIVTNSNFSALLNQYNLLGDITDYVKKNNIDLSIFPKNTLDTIKAMGNGKLIGLPKAMLFNVLYYNKDIFDKFAVKYPKDGMTWDDAYKLAQSLTHEESGVQYYGYQDFRFKPMLMINQLGLQMMDPTSKKVDFSKAGWVDYFNNFQRFFQIPGNTYASGKPNDVLKLWTQGQLAMMAGHVGLIVKDGTFPVGIHWDIAALPSFAKAPQTGTSMDPTVLALSSISKHPNEATLAIQALTGPITSKFNANNGDYPGSTFPDLEKVFGAGVPALKDKHLKSVFYNKPAAPIHSSAEVINDVWPALQKALDSVMMSKQDANTALRTANEAAEKALAADAAK
jgi:multiple sugar transport system substrate-binding protein